MNIDISTHKDLYYDYEKCLSFLKNIDLSKSLYPDEITYFHVYTEIKNELELASVESFLATQNLEKCKLIVWSDYDISDNKLLLPYLKHIELKVYDPIIEAIDTPLDGYLHLLNAKDTKHYLQSDLLRILALYKYGGIWYDMDVILLRDFLPLLKNEYMYMWGSETKFVEQGACATVLSMKKKSEFSTRMIEQIKTTPITPNSTCWGKDMFAKMYSEKPFNVLPSTFFNTEWCINSKYTGYGDTIERCWFDNPCSEANLFLDAFAWHWHNSSNKNKKYIDKSKFGKLKALNKIRLVERKLC